MSTTPCPNSWFRQTSARRSSYRPIVAAAAADGPFDSVPHGRVGQQRDHGRRPGTFVEVVSQPSVDLLAGHGLEFRLHGPVHRIMTVEGRRIFGAPPVEFGPAFAPMATVPLADHRGHPPVR
jgi:hypothetical protein